ncbi:Tripartite-type tricarboxylate transporter, receptor component TctC [Xaviernesmea oryzae]|uniref:Tripartite-type tricarboxylate transporter, receptor component TctC n=1 Tax=Xaviernesmea oryzae TaxID=464029 RepID=A0A1X7FP64_9HYPH|nr:tripartite tricarboxylate transporter substrate binding protein [Xaviernesmea oryzae]SMF56034.1 Tripartite-type tricarboxylate transporter, receptor component TctC [Xaviernesmea oryzae]
MKISHFLTNAALVLFGVPGAAMAADPLLSHCRTITMIVPYTAGGSGDVSARLLTPAMTADLGVPVQVENVPGAGGQIGVTRIATSKPDGCTIGWTYMPGIITSYLDPTRKAAYDQKSFAPVGTYVLDSSGLAVKGDSPYNNLTDLVKAAKAKPGSITVTNAGKLSGGDIVQHRLEAISGADFNILSSAGGAEALADLLGGHVDVIDIDAGGPNGELARTGQIKILAFFSREPIASYPNVTTAKQQGYDLELGIVRTLSAPAGTPEKVVKRLSNALKVAMDDSEVKDKAVKLNIPLHYMDANETAKYWADLESQLKPIVAERLGK